MAIKSDDKLMFEAYKRNLQEKMCTCKKCAACKKRIAKQKKMMKEHHESEYSDEVLQMSVGELLDRLEVEDPELYHRIENHLDKHENAVATAVDTGSKAAVDDTSIEGDIESGLDSMP